MTRWAGVWRRCAHRPPHLYPHPCHIRTPTAPHAATRDTTVPHAARLGACRIAARLDRMIRRDRPRAHPEATRRGCATALPHRAPYIHLRRRRATGHALLGVRRIATHLDRMIRRDRPRAHPEATRRDRTHDSHRAPHSYPRYDGATYRATRRTPYHHLPAEQDFRCHCGTGFPPAYRALAGHRTERQALGRMP